MDEKLEKALECCSRVNCCACPKLKDVNCMSNLYAEVKRYIDELEERIAIMQESIKALEKRNEPIKPEMIMTTGAGIGLSHCPKCGESIDEYHHPSFCGNCGQAVKWI